MNDSIKSQTVGNKWTPTGEQCRLIQATCEDCVMHKAYGFHKEPGKGDNLCFQAEINDSLIKRGKRSSKIGRDPKLPTFSTYL